ncbi:hypothetical protein SK128_025043, partial [Halocaridina rubra]
AATKHSYEVAVSHQVVFGFGSVFKRQISLSIFQDLGPPPIRGIQSAVAWWKLSGVSTKILRLDTLPNNNNLHLSKAQVLL